MLVRDGDVDDDDNNNEYLWLPYLGTRSWCRRAAVGFEVSMQTIAAAEY